MLYEKEVTESLLGILQKYYEPFAGHGSMMGTSRNVGIEEVCIILNKIKDIKQVQDDYIVTYEKVWLILI